MKPIHLDFVPDRRWAWCWMAFVVAVGLIAGASAWPLWKLYQQKTETTSAIDHISKSLRKLREPPRVVNDAQHASAAKAAHLLQTDINPLFTTIESLQQAGAKLSNLSLDLSSGSARMEYTTDSVKSVTEITARLNDGYDSGPWRLESVGAVSAMSGPVQAVRANWVVRLSDLR